MDFKVLRAKDNKRLAFASCLYVGRNRKIIQRRATIKAN